MYRAGSVNVASTGEGDPVRARARTDNVAGFEPSHRSSLLADFRAPRDGNAEA